MKNAYKESNCNNIESDKPCNQKKEFSHLTTTWLELSKEILINLGQKDLLVETQGNWGDIRTGDKAAAPRYIEAKLSKFALDIAFNSNLTKWQSSYDGRKKEPVFLPIKFNGYFK